MGQYPSSYLFGATTYVPGEWTDEETDSKTDTDLFQPREQHRQACSPRARRYYQSSVRPEYYESDWYELPMQESSYVCEDCRDPSPQKPNRPRKQSHRPAAVPRGMPPQPVGPKDRSRGGETARQPLQARNPLPDSRRTQAGSRNIPHVRGTGLAESHGRQFTPRGYTPQDRGHRPQPCEPSRGRPLPSRGQTPPSRGRAPQSHGPKTPPHKTELPHSHGGKSQHHDNSTITIHVISYSKANGKPHPLMPHFNFDVSNLIPPHEDLCRRFTGRDPELANTFFNTADHEARYQRILVDTQTGIDEWLELGARLPRRDFAVLVGCRAGMHRSVAVAERLAKDLGKLRGPGMDLVRCLHMDLGANWLKQRTRLRSGAQSPKV